MANSDVKINVGVSGVSQFKQGMKDSQAAVKNLEQQLKLNEAQLKATGNEELYLQNKTELLTKQIEEQKKTVSQATQALEGMKRNGIEQSSAAFQNMQQQMYKASTQLMEMQTELSGIGESGQDASDSVSEMSYQLSNISRNVSLDNVVNGIGKVTDVMEAAAAAAWNLGKKIVQATLGGASWADELASEASVWEIPAEELYRMRETARIIDTDAETILQARKKLTAAMGKESSKETMGAFAALGIDPSGRHGDINGVFWEAGEALMQMEDKVARNEYATQLFGKSFEDLIPLFSAGREEYEKTFNKWSWIGDEQLEKLTTLDDKYQELQSEWESVQLQFQAQMAEVMTPVMETLTGLLREFNKYLQSEDGQQMMASLGEAISGLFEDIANIDPETVINGIKDAIDGVKAGLEWIKTNKGGIKTAIEAIGIAFGTLKLGGLALNIGRIVSGLKDLFGGGGGNQTTTGAPEAQTTGTAAPSVGGTGTVLFDTVMAQLMATAGAMKEHTRLTNWWKAGGGDVEQWAQFGVDQGYLTQEQAQQNIDFMAKMDELAAATKENTAAQEENSWMPEKSPFAENLQNYYAEPMDRMTQVAGEMSGELAGVQQANTDMTAAAKDLLVLTSLPAEIRQAVADGMASVNIVINEGAVSAIGERVSVGWGGKVQAMTK